MGFAYCDKLFCGIGGKRPAEGHSMTRIGVRTIVARLA
jgi:hypothetical protein